MPKLLNSTSSHTHRYIRSELQNCLDRDGDTLLCLDLHDLARPSSYMPPYISIKTSSLVSFFKLDICSLESIPQPLTPNTCGSNSPIPDARTLRLAKNAHSHTVFTRRTGDVTIKTKAESAPKAAMINVTRTP
jgi:hypothetical protein